MFQSNGSISVDQPFGETIPAQGSQSLRLLGLELGG